MKERKVRKELNRLREQDSHAKKHREELVFKDYTSSLQQRMMGTRHSQTADTPAL